MGSKSKQQQQQQQQHRYTTLTADDNNHIINNREYSPADKQPSRRRSPERSATGKQNAISPKPTSIRRSADRTAATPLLYGQQRSLTATPSSLTPHNYDDDDEKDEKDDDDDEKENDDDDDDDDNDLETFSSPTPTTMEAADYPSGNSSVAGDGNSSILLAVLNFTNSIVGAGVIGLPFALRESGFWSGVILIILLAWIVDWTIGLMMVASKLSSKRTYQGLVGYCFGRNGRVAVSIFQFLFAFGGMCAYIVIIGDTLPMVLRQLLLPSLPSLSSPSSLPSSLSLSLSSTNNAGETVISLFLSRRAVIAWSTVLIMLPLSLYRDISKLAKASAAALLALIFIIITVAIKGPATTNSDNNGTLELHFIQPGILQSIGVISFAFVCHHNSFLIYGSLRRPTLDRWNRVTHWSTGVSCVLSLAMAIAGYLSFGQQTQGNILNNFGDDRSILVALARLCFAANMFTTFPLELFVCREVLEFHFADGRKRRTTLAFHFTVTVLLCAVPMTIALATCNLGVMLELTGCFSAAALAYILPPACYIHLASGRWMEGKKLRPLGCIILGIIVLILSTGSTVYSALHDDSVKDCRW